jgi:hypothetical protein
VICLNVALISRRLHPKTTVSTDVVHSLLSAAFHTAVHSISESYKENIIIWDIKTVHTSQETHYVSAAEPSRSMVCRILGFHKPVDSINLLCS